MGDDRLIAVLGATGLQGKAVVRQLAAEGWRVRAVTRRPQRKKATRLASMGVDVVQADMDDAASLERAFSGVEGVFCVQNHRYAGYDGELRQAKIVTDVALRLGVPHLVYSGAGTGRADTGIGSWDTKARIIEHMNHRGVPMTVLRPMAFMELMTEPKFFPWATAWHVMPKLMGAARPVPWLAVDDLAVIIAKAFADPQTFIGQDLALAADVLSVDQCRRLWQETTGRAPIRLPMPVWVLERMAGTDETTMWRWLGTNEIPLDVQPTRQMHPTAQTVRTWLAHRNAAAARSAGNAPPAGAQTP